jgi:two-component system chemotaxis response regulator CheY
MPTDTARRFNVLLVDDSRLMRTLLKRAVELSQIPLGSVFEASNGREALAVLEAHTVDALFTDINMPEMTGFELLSTINQQARWKTMVRVVISANDSAAERTRSEELGASQYVDKPFTPDAVRVALSRLL